MENAWQFQVYDHQQLLLSGEFTGALTLGRQANPSEKPYSLTEQKPGHWRAVVGSLEEPELSRRHVLLEPLPGDRVRITNQSASQSIWLGNQELAAQAPFEQALPLQLRLGCRTVHVCKAGSESRQLQSLLAVTSPPGRGSRGVLRSEAQSLLQAPGGNVITLESLLEWMQGVLEVLQSAASSSDFFARAARALVDLVGLDRGSVLLRDNEEFRPQSEHAATSDSMVRSEPSRHILAEVCRHKRTFWQEPGAEARRGESLVGIQAVVAAPILDQAGEVIGVLYGDRRDDGKRSGGTRISRQEAVLVEVLAVGVAAGLARVKEEQAALRARVQLEQFFPREVLVHLDANPQLLDGRDLEVTVLFADIRGFSRISERLGPARTVEWVRALMEGLTECVMARHGVLVDFHGDEIMAMWGAPVAQPDHAQRACQTALDILDRVPEWNTRWQPVLHESLALGIGVHTGLARVGNVGTTRRMKYGPLGNTVNLGSLVQGATKHLKCRLLLTGATRAQLDASFACRKLCRVCVVNIAEPVSLYELARPDEPDWSEAIVEYERALAHFEARNFAAVAHVLGNWRARHPGDGPALLLQYRALQCELDDATDFNPVWVLPGK